ncbi:MAG: cell division protein FtsW [Schwartzia sp.]|nr:cell division protein FtsW [Schwartzia sp. (in: firmicutes)]
MTLAPDELVTRRKFWMNDCEAVLGITLLLLIIGTLNVFSSSFVLAETNFGTPYFFLKKHGLNLVFGLAIFAFCWHLNYQRWRDWIVPIFFFVSLMLVVVLVAGISVNGARRWLSLGIITIQPAEFAKIVAIFLEAAYISTQVSYGFAPKPIHSQLTFIAIMAVLVEREPDGATAAIIIGIPVLMMWFSNMKFLHKLYLLITGFVGFVFICLLQPYRWARLLSMLDPWADPQGTGYQVVQSLQAIGSGGLFGMGLGVGISKYHYLPEAHTDFAFAIWCQELGFLGALLVFILFACLAYYGCRIALSAKEPLGQMLAVGLTALIVGQAIANLFMICGWGPVIGVPLPFISYGGSSLAVSLGAIGILLNIGSQNAPPKQPATSAPPPDVDIFNRPRIRRIK